MHGFQMPFGDDAGGAASVGRGKLALMPGVEPGPPLLRVACREARGGQVGEQDLLSHIVAIFDAAGYNCQHSLIANYYVSLKTNPFVILTGAQGCGKAAFAQIFAESIVGRSDTQYALIPGGAAWTRATGEDGYYRAINERFCSMRFLELLQEAALPTNVGRAYMVCFERLHPVELEHYFAELLRVTPDGRKRLNLPGVPLEHQPVVPPNVYITATVDTTEHALALSPAVLRHAGLLEFRSPALRPSQRLRIAPPPVGYQRIWLRSAVHDLESARARLVRVLGGDQLTRLHASPELAHLMWRAGVALTSQTLQELTRYIANSFDERGNGLFDPSDPQRNAALAFDAQVSQRVLWRLQALGDTDLQRDIAGYLERLVITVPHQAVA